ncbi:MAG: hypothetical protein RM368_32690 [Nostoc sp. DedSLP03]|nr:hypothetical protein [Nostoc sp. DedSLP03]MDZ7969647.1 hypothetical protein [Nostoc sp. DedSLP03]
MQKGDFGQIQRTIKASGCITAAIPPAHRQNIGSNTGDTAQL